MAVSINQVYQKVLAIANKEQRGYITPQEFNLFADRAQRQIYEAYFDDIRNAEAKIKNQQQFSDIVEQTEEKLQYFKRVFSSIIGASNTPSFSVPSNCSRIISAELGSGTYMANTNTWYPIEIISQRELRYIMGNPLTAPTTKRPIAVREEFSDNDLDLFPATTQQHPFKVHYYALPSIPKWTYVIVNEQALYNEQAPDANDFDLHGSEEENLVNRILQLAGISIEKPDVQQAGIVAKQMADQDKNN